MVPLGVSFSLLIEDQGLIEVDLSGILDPFDSNQFTLCPLFSSVQLLSHVQVFATPWTAKRYDNFCSFVSSGYVIFSNIVPCPLPSCFNSI